MITITVPIFPSSIAIIMLICLVCGMSKEGGFGLVGGIIPFIGSAAAFFMLHGMFSMLD